MNNYVIIAITLASSAFFSGMEIAFVSSNKLRIELEKGKGLLSARLISGFIHHPSRFIGAMLIGNNISLVIYGIAAAAILGPVLKNTLPPALASESIILVFQTVLSTTLILITAEFLPKILFRLNPNGLLSLFALPVYLIYLMLYPFMYFFLGLSELILRYIFGMKTGSVRYQFTAIDFDDYIRDFYNPAAAQVDEATEMQMIQNVRDFHSTKVRECMVPRNEIIAVDDSIKIEELHGLFMETQHSKIPVYKQSIDNLTGYVHLYDLFGKPADLNTVVRPVIIVPETIAASKVLDMMISQRKSVAVVVDEFGGTAGMVTVEDLIEEIFGEIEDEFDVEELLVKKVSETEFILAGRLEIDYLNQEYFLNLPQSDEYETLAGLILNHHQSIPEIREQIQIDRFIFTILEASGSRIDKVMMKIEG
ncbi:MAG: hemolysin family protein [Bacteroidales bacterium]|nr:hemolysin family protein [Bacteroidales bacterium]